MIPDKVNQNRTGGGNMRCSGGLRINAIIIIYKEDL